MRITHRRMVMAAATETDSPFRSDTAAGTGVLKRFVWLFIVLPAGVLMVALALANRHIVRLSLDPFSSETPFLAFEAPLFVFLLAAVLAGLLIGGCLTWFKQGRWRRAARENSREAATLKAINRQLDERLSASGSQRFEPSEAGE